MNRLAVFDIDEIIFKAVNIRSVSYVSDSGLIGQYIVPQQPKKKNAIKHSLTGF